MTLASTPMPESPDLAPSPPAGGERPSGTGDALLRIVGGVVVVVAALATATLELMFARIRVGGHLIGMSALLAVAANVVLSWFAQRAVGGKWAFALPAVPWFLLIAAAGSRTHEGDLLLAGDWVGLLTVVGGSIAFAVMGFRSILTPPR